MQIFLEQAEVRHVNPLLSRGLFHSEVKRLTLSNCVACISTYLRSRAVLAPIHRPAHMLQVSYIIVRPDDNFAQVDFVKK